MKTIIAPSLLSADFSDLKSELEKLNNLNNIWLHLDVMDGHFVPNLTFGATVLKNLHLSTQHPLDAHLMVEKPQDYLESFAKLNLHNFTFHIESSTGDTLGFIKKAKLIFPSVGITLKPLTPIEKLTNDILRHIDLVLIMSVEPGFGGQSFITNSDEKIKWLDNKRKELQANYLIQVDGGINERTSKLAIEAGADILVAGSYIFKKEDYSQAVREIRSS